MEAQQDRDQIMKIFRDALYNHGDLHALSARSGLSFSCLTRIRSGGTKWPRWATLEILMIILNIRMIVKQY